MDPERWWQIERLFHTALEHEPADRATFLSEACRQDDEPRRRVPVNGK